MKKVIGQKYLSECLIDHITKQPIMLEHTERSDEIQKIARESAENLMKALNDPSEFTPI